MASRAVILFAGSNLTIFSSKSSPFSSKLGDTVFKAIGFHFGNVCLKSGNDVTPFHIDSVGVPKIWKILKIWSISESPANRGLL